MRTTIDLDPDLHEEAVAIARSTRRSLSAVVNEALEKSLRPVGPVRRDDRTGLNVITIGRPITSDDVADALDDD